MLSIEWTGFLPLLTLLLNKFRSNFVRLPYKMQCCLYVLVSNHIVFHWSFVASKTQLAPFAAFACNYHSGSSPIVLLTFKCLSCKVGLTPPYKGKVESWSLFQRWWLNGSKLVTGRPYKSFPMMYILCTAFQPASQELGVLYFHDCALLMDVLSFAWSRLNISSVFFAFTCRPTLDAPVSTSLKSSFVNNTTLQRNRECG